MKRFPNSIALIMAISVVSNPMVTRWAEAQEGTRPVDGLRSHDPDFHALTGLRIVIKPGEQIEAGTIVLRDGVVTRVSRGKEVPAGCRVWDLTGKTAYAGFIDAYSGTTSQIADMGGKLYWNHHVRPGRTLAGQAGSDQKNDIALRKEGVLLRVVSPQDGVIKGQSVLVSTGEGDFPDRIVDPSVAIPLRLTIPFNRDRDYYPNSPMGAVALARQAMCDAEWYRRAWGAYRAQAGLPSPEVNQSLAVLSDFLDKGRLFVAEVSNEQGFVRADRFAREFSLRLAIAGSGNEYRRLDAVRATGRQVIVPVDFPKPPDVSTAERAAEVSLSALMDWALAPENPGRLDAAGVPICLTSSGLKSRGEFLKNVRRAVRRGLGAESALAALTIRPAALLGIEDKYGTLEPGKIANIVIADGNLFSDSAQVSEVWYAGQRYPLVERRARAVQGVWALMNPSMDEKMTLTLEGGKKLEGHFEIERIEELAEEAASDEGQESSKYSLKKLRFVAGRLEAQFVGTIWADQNGDEAVRLSATYLAEPPGLIGKMIRPDGSELTFEASLVKATEDDEKGEKEDGKGEQGPDDVGLVEVNYPLGAFGLKAVPEREETLVIENATLWTCSSAGILEKGMMLVERGEIKAVGEHISVPDGARRIDASGLHLTPGIIDCHSHMATDGGVNESTQAITAEVRIEDFIDANDINIYRQLAGGVTAANILHGSANPIGGQNQVIKLRWGASDRDLRFAEAPAGIKFALGENVKQSNRGDSYTTRYPQTRMGVEQIMKDAFTAAIAYGKRWDTWNLQHHGLPPRRDLEMEALLEIVRGERWIHCHSYRQDEILALIRTLDTFGIRIGTFQHILEGYKVAPEMRRHGAMASSFSDWWAYKFEVIDAIPYNGALMHEAGIVVSFNSDDRELARRLNLEAAKAVKYGKVSREEALKFVTLNPAKQLRIDSYVGSLEPCKQADFVLWSGSPLSNLSRCEQTWIDGRCYFSIAKDRELREEAMRLRKHLVKRILRSGEKMVKPGEGKVDEAALWPRDDLFCFPHHHRERHSDEHDAEVYH